MARADGYLLDTHALIWWWLSDPRLPENVRALMAAPDLPIYVSAISAYEIGLKVRTGELAILAEALDTFGESVEDEGFRNLPIRCEHTAKAAMLGDTSKDPFDRIIASQALAEDMIVLSRDKSMAVFGCKTVW